MTHNGLNIRDLVVGYGRRDPVLHGINIEIKPGKLVAMLGPNGSGKSTLLHSILGLIPIRQGSVELLGRPIATLQRTHVGFCADDLPLPTLLTGREFLSFSACARGVNLSENEITQLFAATNMAGSERRMIREYSHGMKRKLMLISNILHSPALLVLDEPFRGLDPEAHQVMLTVIQASVARGSIVLVSTHDLAVAARTSDEVVVLDQGHVRYLGNFDTGADGVTELAERFAGIVNSDDVHASRSAELFDVLDRVRSDR